jgi:hypothetical protein
MINVQRVCHLRRYSRYDSIEGYLFNIGMLKNVFKPAYTMHSIEQTGDWELSTRRGCAS